MVVGDPGDLGANACKTLERHSDQDHAIIQGLKMAVLHAQDYKKMSKTVLSMVHGDPGVHGDHAKKEKRLEVEVVTLQALKTEALCAQE